MKKLSKILAVLFAVILAVSVFAFAEEVDEEKRYVVYPSVTLFTVPDNPAGFYVVSQEELDEMLEFGMVAEYRECVRGVFTSSVEIDYNWDIELVNAFKVHNKYTGRGIKIGIIDSGIDRGHPNFLGIDDSGTLYCRVEYGHNYVTGMDDNEASVEATKDEYGHGTTVAGKAAGRIFYDNDGKAFGVSGVAPDATLVPLKVSRLNEISGEYYADDADVANAIYDAVDDYECQIINISICFDESTDELKKAIDYATKENVIVVASVGNEGAARPLYPAAYDNVIGVGATDKDGNVWVDVDAGAGSQQNESVFITAPGTDVVAAWSYDAPVIENDQPVVDENGNIKQFDFVLTEGTSVSAPLVSGAVALLKQANPALEPDDIRNILANSATDDAKDDGYDKAYGYGILNVEKAVELALENDINLAPVDISYVINAKDISLSSAIIVENYTPGNIGSHPLGASFTAKAEPEVTIGNDTYKFAYWANGNGTYVSGKATYTFTATSNFSLYAVYDKLTNSSDEIAEKKVEFWNGNGVLLDTKTANDEGIVASTDIPENPEMTGYAFDCWFDEDKNKFTAERILEKNLTRVVAQFKDKETTYSITFKDKNDTTVSGTYGEKKEYTASGESFDYWTLDGKIVSYDPSIEIALWGDGKTLTAEYNDDKGAVPTVVLDDGADNANFLIYSVPDGYEIIDAGIVFGTEGSTPRVASFHSKASVKKLPDDGFGQFTSLPGDEAHTVARGYLIYKDPGKVTRVIYADK